MKKFLSKLFKYLGYIFEFMHSPFTVIAKEVDGKIHSDDPPKEEEGS